MRNETKDKAQIALVDDDPDFRRILEGWLESDYQVVPFQDAEGFLDALPEQTPDVVILDVRLPGLDGFRACKALRSDERYAQVPVLFLTASDDDVDFVRNMEV